MKKIGILIDTINTGGVEKIAIEEVKGLRALGDDAYLLVLKRPEKLSNFNDLIRNVPIVFLDDRLPEKLKLSFKIPFFSFFSFFHISYPFILPWYVKNKEFDYLIVHSTYTVFSAIALKKFRDISFSAYIWDPIGVLIEDYYKNKFSKLIYFVFLFLGRIFDKFIISSSDVILIGGNAHTSYLKKIGNKPEITVLPPGINMWKFSYKKGNYCVMATAWKKGKEPELVMPILKSNPQLKIKMIGKWIDPIYRSEFEKLVKNNGVSKNIEIVGELSEKDMAKSYAKALFFLQVKSTKGFSLPPLEAAGNGTSFIIPEGQGVCALFENKRDGFFVPDKNIKEINCAIRLLINDKKKAILMGKKAQKVAKNYTWLNHTKKLRNLIYEKSNE